MRERPRESVRRKLLELVPEASVEHGLKYLSDSARTPVRVEVAVA